MNDGRIFASTSLPRHLLRGAVGFGALTGAVALLPAFGPGSLLLAPIGLVALRGCPTCWALGLVQTISAGRLRRSCADGRCELTVAGRAQQNRELGEPVDHVTTGSPPHQLTLRPPDS